MAKKKTTREVKPKETFKTQIRLDGDVAEKLKLVADEAEISLNQLMNGALRWVAKYARAGEAQQNDFGEWYTRPCLGVVFVGEPATYEMEWGGKVVAVVANKDGEGGDKPCVDKGIMYFMLDFTGRNVVREKE